MDTEKLGPNGTISAILVAGGAPGCPFHLFFGDLQNISLVRPIEQFALSCFALVSRLSRKLDVLEKKVKNGNTILISTDRLNRFPIFRSIHRLISEKSESDRYGAPRSLFITVWGTTGVNTVGHRICTSAPRHV